MMSTASILGQTRPTQLPPEWEALVMMLLLAVTLVSPIIAWAVGVFRRHAVAGPPRLEPSDSAGRFLLILCAAVLSFIVGTAILAPLMFALPEAQRPMAAGMAAYIFAFIGGLAANSALRRDGVRLLGLTSPGLGPGLLGGFVGLLIVFPWLIWLMTGATLLLQKLNVHVPTEHPIFQLWQRPETPALFRIIAYISAVFFAPLAEELVFRGVIQTGLLRLFSRNSPPVQPPPPPPDAPPGQPLVLSYAPAPVPPPPLISTPAARWAAVIIASVLFAAVHQPLFIIPPIFLLSLGLGYVYERTGNLWSCIFMHMLFNGFQFTIFLLMR